MCWHKTRHLGLTSRLSCGSTPRPSSKWTVVRSFSVECLPNHTAPAPGEGFYIGNWARLHRIDDGRTYLVVQGHCLLAQPPTISDGAQQGSARTHSMVAGGANIIMLVDTNDNQMNNDLVRETVFDWTASDPALKPITDPRGPGSTCCFEAKGCSAGVVLCCRRISPTSRLARTVSPIPACWARSTISTFCVASAALLTRIKTLSYGF